MRNYCNALKKFLLASQLGQNLTSENEDELRKEFKELLRWEQELILLSINAEVLEIISE